MTKIDQQQIHINRMKRALELARRGQGKTSPNPMVGAVVVNNGETIGEGYHLYVRRHHAEVEALEQAGEKAQGGDLYVTLEPCHHQGRTPPCVEKIIESGIKRVFVAIRDPNPQVCGGGIEALRENGIEVVYGLCESEARRLNEVFFHFVNLRKPFVVLKLALSLDGRIATFSGSSNWITGERSRRDVHRMRFIYDSILVGINTILQDDPSLSVRWSRRKSILKIVLDTRLRIPPDSRIFESGDPVLIFHGKEFSLKKKQELMSRAELVEIEQTQAGLSWSGVMSSLWRRQRQSLLVEGGGQVAGSLLESGYINRLVLYYGPKIIGKDGIPGFGLKRIDDLAQAPPVSIRRVSRMGDDFRIEAEPIG